MSFKLSFLLVPLLSFSCTETATDTTHEENHRLSEVDVFVQVEVFQLNAAENPDSWNVFDSLAEGYANQGKTELAIEHYEQSLVLNPDNQNGVDQLSILRQL